MTKLALRIPYFRNRAAARDETRQRENAAAYQFLVLAAQRAFAAGREYERQRRHPSGLPA